MGECKKGRKGSCFPSSPPYQLSINLRLCRWSPGNGSDPLDSALGFGFDGVDYLIYSFERPIAKIGDRERDAVVKVLAVVRSSEKINSKVRVQHTHTHTHGRGATVVTFYGNRSWTLVLHRFAAAYRVLQRIIMFSANRRPRRGVLRSTGVTANDPSERKLLFN